MYSYSGLFFGHREDKEEGKRGSGRKQKGFHQAIFNSKFNHKNDHTLISTPHRIYSFILEKICSMSTETIRAKNQHRTSFSSNSNGKKYEQGTYISFTPHTCTSVTQTIRYKQTCVHFNYTNSKG